MAKRPEWCTSSGCPYYPGVDTCVLRDYVNRGWLNHTSRKLQIKKIAKLNGEEIIQKCLSASFPKEELRS